MGRFSSILLLVALLASPASARTEILRWTHNDPANVAGFTIYYGASSRDYTTDIDAPPLSPDAQGIFIFDIDIPDGATIYVAVTAYDGAGQESGYSNEQMRGPALVLGKPGTPYVVSGPTEETLTVFIVPTGGDGPTVSSLVTNGVGPYQFLFDCGLDGNWNGVTNTPQPAASYICDAGTSTIKAQVWDQGTGAVLSEVVAVGN